MESKPVDAPTNPGAPAQPEEVKADETNNAPPEETKTDSGAVNPAQG